MALSDLLERGYFPKELPNPFITGPFSAAVTAAGVVLPLHFEATAVDKKRVPLSMSVKYSHARGGLARRLLELPNPLSYYHLCREIDSNWPHLFPHISNNSLSATVPTPSPRDRAIRPASNQDERRELSTSTRLNNRYILRTDISRFYHSIYTHSIPWALHTKPVAKQNHSMALLGNRLDYIARSGQDGQTLGIPIGPDTSLVIAEAVLQKCDAALLAKLPGVRGHRIIDDYELGFRHRSEAEVAFHCLGEVLSDFELALNLRKTEIVELPTNLEPSWVEPIRSCSFRTTPAGQRGDLFRFFDIAFELHEKNPDDAVLQFAVGRLRSLNVQPSNWRLFQQLLLNAAVPEPATLPYVLQAIIVRVNSGAQPALTEIGDILNQLIASHAGQAHSSEVAWSLWACLALHITLSADAVSAVSRCENSVIAILALHCQANGLCSTGLDVTNWSRSMDSKGLHEENWLLSYEANVKGWLPSVGGGDHVASDPDFAFLKTAGVSFYDTSLATAVQGAPIPVPRPPAARMPVSGSMALF